MATTEQVLFIIELPEAYANGEKCILMQQRPFDFKGMHENGKQRWAGNCISLWGGPLKEGETAADGTIRMFQEKFSITIPMTAISVGKFFKLDEAEGNGAISYTLVTVDFKAMLEAGFDANGITQGTATIETQESLLTLRQLGKLWESDPRWIEASGVFE